MEIYTRDYKGVKNVDALSRYFGEHNKKNISSKSCLTITIYSETKREFIPRVSVRDKPHQKNTPSVQVIGFETSVDTQNFSWGTNGSTISGT